MVLRAAAGDWVRVTLHNRLSARDAKQLGTNTSGAKSSSASSTAVQPYNASTTVGLHPALVAYDPSRSASLNIGNNPVQTVAPGESRTYTWYAGIIDQHDGQRRLTPVEFGAVNLMPAGPLLQASYGLSASLIVEPAGSNWVEEDPDRLVAEVFDADHKPLFTEVVIAGNISTDLSAPAGTEVRFRVLNPGAGTLHGSTSNNTNLIVVEGHNWAEEPYTDDSRVIGDNPLSQTLGSQQVTPLESYNLVLPQAGGVDRVPGIYGFYYYPNGPSEKTRLGVLVVTPAGS